jgi:hypothetical protein
MRLTKQLPNPENVVAGQTFVQRCPVGLTYDRIMVALTNITLAQLTNIEVLANGKSIQKFNDGQQLQDLNTFYGRPTNTNELTLFFERPEFITLPDQRACALGTSDVQTLIVKGDINAACVNPAILCYAVQSAPSRMGLVTKIKQTPVGFTAAGVVSFDQMVRAARLLALHYGKTDVNNVVIEADGRRVVDMTKTQLENMLKDVGRVPVTARFTHVDMCMDGDLSQALVADPAVVKDFRQLLTLGTSGTVNLMVEYLDGFEGI